MAGHKSCYTMIEPIHLGETRKLARRNFLRSAGVLVSALSCMPTLAAQDNRMARCTLRSRPAKSLTCSDCPTPGHRIALFPICAGAAKNSLVVWTNSSLRQEISELPLTEVFSVQVYKEIQAIERLVKRPGKATGRDSVNATISMRMDFLVRTSRSLVECKRM